MPKFWKDGFNVWVLEQQTPSNWGNHTGSPAEANWSSGLQVKLRFINLICTRLTHQKKSLKLREGKKPWKNSSASGQKLLSGGCCFRPRGRNCRWLQAVQVYHQAGNLYVFCSPRASQFWIAECKEMTSKVEGSIQGSTTNLTEWSSGLNQSCLLKSYWF